MSRARTSLSVPSLLTLALVAATCNQALDGVPDERTSEMKCDPQSGCDPPSVCGKSGICLLPGTCAENIDCEAGKMCVQEAGAQSKVCVVGSGCGGMEASAEDVPANLLIVLDRSCSMRDKVGQKTKWQIAVEALGAMTADYKGRIRFGLTLFPDTEGNNCTQGQIPIPIGPDKETAIQKLLTDALDTRDRHYPDGPCVTNIDTGMEQAAGEPALKDPTRRSFILLITDGKQAGCSAAGGDNGTTKIITDLFKMGVPTFVVGFGSGIDPNQMNTFARAGGVPTGDPMTAYYKAENQVDLNKALATIAGRALGCTMQLGQRPPNPAEIFIFFDNATRVPRDPARMNGWTYDAQKNQIEFFGPACDDLRSGTVKDLDVVFGCDSPTIG